MSDNSNTAMVQADTLAPAVMEQVVAVGDLSKLTPGQRLSYYSSVCKSLGLNPLTKPFEYITLNSKLTLYARRDATDQLRATRRVSVQIISRERVEDVYVVTARATAPDGRTDESIGAVSIGGLKGDALANALMKAETKSKRRVTLSIVGLGWLDETEIETIPAARVIQVNDETGEIMEPSAKASVTKSSQEFEDDTAEQSIARLKAQILAEHERQGLTGARWSNYILEHMGKPGKALNVEELKRLLLNLECDAIKAKLKLDEHDWLHVVDAAIGEDVRPPVEEQTVEQWGKIKSCLLDLAADRGVKV